MNRDSNPTTANPLALPDPQSANRNPHSQQSTQLATISRRAFMEGTGLAVAGITALGPVGSATAYADGLLKADFDKDKPLKKTYRAAAIGSTGHGGFGHGLDRVFRGLPGVEYVAIADDNPDGLKAAGERAGVDRRYTDYREMLKKEKLDIVSVGMRHAKFHEEIVVDCANAGKHIYCEKPLAPDLESADRMLDACEKNGVQMAVAVPNRTSLAIHRALEMVQEGRIGKLLSLRARGKEDRRGGGEDLMVLGFHVLDLMCLFAGYPKWTFAQIMQDGREMVKSDGRAASEPVGPVAGDWLAAMYGFPNGVHGYFESHRGLKGGVERFGLEIHGSEGIIATRSMRDVMWFEGPILNPAKPHHWKRITTPEWDAIRENNGHKLWCGQQIVLDLLRGVEDGREPLSSGKNARWVQEMIQSVYTSHLAKARLSLPLELRKHPLS